MEVVCCVSNEDIFIVPNCIKSLNLYLEPKKIFIISSNLNFKYLRKLKNVFPNIRLIDEDNLIPGFNLENIKNYFRKLNKNTRRCGWYYQQFLKMQISFLEDIDQDYLIWDIDTILLKKMKYINKSGNYIIYRNNKCHKPYFDTIEKLLEIKKNRNYSFINENLIINKLFMQKLILKISSVDTSNHWIINILNNIDNENLTKSGFSEFETYGSYISEFHKDYFTIKKTRSMRYTYSFFGNPNEYSTYVGLFLSRYSWATFEKWDKTKKRKIFLKLIFIFISNLNKALGLCLYKFSKYFNLNLKIIKEALYLANE